MQNYICAACGTQYHESENPPTECFICQDERQYVGWEGQKWTTIGELKQGHKNVFEFEEANLTSIRTEPRFAIGQRALLIQSPSGNVLWDCISFIDDKTLEEINKLGGLSAIAVSHPHFNSSIAEWSKAFGDIPVYINKADSQWLARKDGNLILWEGGRFEISDGIELVHCGGHFDGSSVLYWREGAGGNGALLAADTINVVQDRRFVSFMYSYPNLIPLSTKAVQKIVNAVEPYAFDKIYGGWKNYTVNGNAKEAVKASAERYIK